MFNPKNVNVAAVVAAAASVFAPGYAAATVVTPGVPVTITQSFAYSNYGGGDFVFTTSGQASGCESGWYMKTTDPGYKAAVSVVLTAQAAGLQVIVYGDTADLWSGSPSGHFCRIQTVGVSS
jgi:multidrug efflux pump subunit AcrA (membrane-fusion protein)